jgi:putative DNA primase/helicase
LADVPTWLREAAAASNGKSCSPKELPQEFLEGERNTKLTSLAGRLRYSGLGEEAIFAVLMAENEERCVPPLDESELQTIARSVSRYAPTRPYQDGMAAEDEFTADQDATLPPPKPIELESGISGISDFSDEWVARLLLPAARNHIRYLPSDKQWCVWAGHRWARDQALQHELIVRGFIQQLVIELTHRAHAGSATGEGAKYASAARRVQSAQGVKNVVRLLQAPLACTPGDFDADPWSLNTPDGVVDLRTGELAQPEPGRMFMRSTLHGPGQGDAPKWRAFLRDLTGGDDDLVRYLQKVAGYVLTGEMSEKILLNVWGSDSDTGKSTFIRVLGATLADYADASTCRCSSPSAPIGCNPSWLVSPVFDW